MLALSIKQPWAWLIATGLKDIENRSWRTKFRGIFLIHASKKIDQVAYDHYSLFFDLPDISKLKTGGIVGQSELIDCVDDHKSDWFFGPYGFMLRNSKPLPFSPCRGWLYFFQPDRP
jgi:hypothetical protein